MYLRRPLSDTERTLDAPPAAAKLLGAVVTSGLLAGLALDVLTWLVARYGPQGGGGQPWSLRGNGALIVPLGLGPAVIAGVWTAVALHYRSMARWQALSIASGFIGGVFPLGSVLVLVAFGSAGQRLSDWLSLGGVGWMVLAPALALVLPVAHGHDRHLAAAHAAVGLAFTIALVLGFVATGLVLPPGS